MKAAGGVRLAAALAASLIAAGCASSPSDRQFDAQMDKASDVNTQLGAQYLRTGNLQLAKKKLDKALRQNSDNADAHATYALLDMRLGKPDDARDHFERALDSEPDNPQLLNNYGTFLCQQGDHEQGIRYFLKAADNPLYQTPAYAYANAGRCAMQADQPQKARGYLRQALEADPRMGSALFDLAQLELQLGRPATAERYIKRYHNVATPAADSLWLGIRIARRLDDERMAREYGRQLLRDFPDSRQADEFLETR